MTPVVAIERMPFFVGPIAPDAPPHVPEALPFRLGVDARYGLVRQIVDDELRDALARAYRAGSMLSTPLGHGSFGGARLNAAMAALLTAFVDEPRGKLFLEIGCGEGDALAALRQCGADVMGIEIGPQGERGSRRHGIEILATPFETARLARRFDCIYSFGCLEHIEDLAAFWETIRAHLNDGGLTFHTVPDFGATMASLRKEDLAHEHINYFTASSARTTLAAEGFATGGAITSLAGNEIYMWGRHCGGATEAPHDGATNALQDFARRLTASWESERRFFETCNARNETIGLYAGGFLSAVLAGQGAAVRYYDGDAAKHGRSWLKRLPTIRAPESLKNDPVDHLVVSPVHHFDAIAHHLTCDLQVTRRIALHRGFDAC